ncbi:MAG: aspartate ammonia-lyase [Deltaproteobacteria bacterium]|nr:aspartate ammonia-lyase [Deltaproteobacteria bacterium]
MKKSPTKSSATHRIEKDSLGEKQIPNHVYYGVQTARAVDNFPISGWKPNPAFVDATVLIKKAAAAVHGKLGLIPKKHVAAIAKACDEVLGGQHREHFVVDVFQAGAGTSHHMNVNEVLANRANEFLGGKRGSYSPINPNDHVNMAQSTNDVIPTAIRIAALLLKNDFLGSLGQLQKSFAKKAKAWDKIIKSGRTHLQDATPIRLGQEFGGYASCLASHLEWVKEAFKPLHSLGLGGTAVGTGINSHPKYRTMVAQELGKLIDEPLKPAKDYFEAMQSMSPFVGLSNALRNLTLDLIRIANDLRLLASGPRTGLYEIVLPAVQPGSSIMPGKVNPVLAEMTDMAGYFVLGLDTTIAYSSQAGQLELNVMMPIIAYCLTWELTILTNTMQALSTKCIEGLIAFPDRCRYYAENSVSIATVLNPILGYAATAEIVKKAVATGKPLRDLLVQTNLTKAQIDQVFDLYDSTYPNLKGGTKAAG